MVSDRDRFWFESFEDRGEFLHVTFDGEDEETVIFIADKDFENLKDLAADPETEPDKFRSEVFELVDHTGHEDEHELSLDSTRQLMETVRTYEPEPKGASTDGDG